MLQSFIYACNMYNKFIRQNSFIPVLHFAGFIMYFKYGIKNSSLEIQEDPAVELTVAGSPSVDPITGMRTTSLSTHK